MLSDPGQLYAFIDESYQQDHYYTAAVVVTCEQRSQLCQGLDAVANAAAERFGVDPSIELHGHPMMQGLQDWEAVRGRVNEAVALYRHAMRAIRGSGARVLIEGVDVNRLNARYKYPDSPYEVTLRHLLERINDLAERQGASGCTVKADMISKHQDFQEAIEGYTRVGTPGYRSQKLERITQPVVWVDSGTERGIQAADLVVYMHRRYAEPDPGGNPRARRATRTIMRELEPALCHVRKWEP